MLLLFGECFLELFFTFFHLPQHLEYQVHKLIFAHLSIIILVQLLQNSCHVVVTGRIDIHLARNVS